MAAVDYFNRDPVVHTWTYSDPAASTSSSLVCLSGIADGCCPACDRGRRCRPGAKLDGKLRNAPGQARRSLHLTRLATTFPIRAHAESAQGQACDRLGDGTRHPV